MALRRSMLFVPGSDDEAKQRQTIGSCGADIVCLDLEDTVVPARKAQARGLIARLLQEDIWGRSDRALRINAVSTPYARDDIVEVLRGCRGRLDTIMMSKVDSAQEVIWADELVTSLTREHGFCGEIKLSVGIESARALTDIDKIAASSKRLECLGFAIGDLSISLGVRVATFLRDRSSYPGDLFHFVRSRINLAAKAHGLLSLDGPWPILNDHATLAEDARWGAMLGFDGKLALSVAQVRIIHEAYRPTPEEIAHARRVLALYEQSVAAGSGSMVVDGEFMDPVTLGFANATLARAAAPI